MNKLKLLGIAGIVIVIVIIGGIFLFRGSENLPMDIGANSADETMNEVVDAIRDENIDRAERYFVSANEEGRATWKEILRVNKDRDLMEEMANGIGSSEFFKKISDTEEQYLMTDQLGTAGLLIGLIFNPEISAWQINSLVRVEISQQ
ncbi:MAG: hypothetical protein HYT03_01320 [Candidatus Harrisonbacteria bacterium]|nr:hypothetical protein [Candidatus Harrisonbacteria bacterium]